MAKKMIGVVYRGRHEIVVNRFGKFPAGEVVSLPEDQARFLNNNTEFDLLEDPPVTEKKKEGED